MPLLSNLGRTAQTRSTYVYAFRRLAKLHDVRTGSDQDFYELPETLRANPEFEADLFRVARSAVESSPELSVRELVAIVALAMGGDGIAASRELEVPEHVVELFRRAVGSGEEIEAASAAAPGTAEPSRQAESVPKPGFPQEIDPAPPQVVSMPPAPPGRPPILQQALLADVPDVGSRPRAKMVAEDIQRLESERAELERRLRKMERRLHLVARRVESLQGGRVDAPVAPAPEHRVGAAEAARDGRGFTAAGPRRMPRPVAHVAEAQPLPTPPADPDDARRNRLVELVEQARAWSDVLLFFGVLTFAIIVVAITAGHRHATHAAAPQPAPAAAGTTSSDADDWVAPGAARVGVAPLSGARAQAEADITRTLGSWAQAFVNNDPAAEASFYAPAVDRYFLRRNVSRDYVLKDKQSYRDRGNRIQHFTVTGLDFQFQSPASAVVTFTKSWSVTGPQQTGYPHSTRSRVWMTRLPEGWRITGEQDLRPAA